jgi:hypothetical protein
MGFSSWAPPVEPVDPVTGRAGRHRSGFSEFMLAGDNQGGQHQKEIPAQLVLKTK